MTKIPACFKRIRRRHAHKAGYRNINDAKTIRLKFRVRICRHNSAAINRNWSRALPWRRRDGQTVPAVTSCALPERRADQSSSSSRSFSLSFFDVVDCAFYFDSGLLTGGFFSVHLPDTSNCIMVSVLPMK